MTVEEKILAYNRANRAVAILCNHQRAAPKTFEKSMQLLQEKVRLNLLCSPSSVEPLHLSKDSLFIINF